MDDTWLRRAHPPDLGLLTDVQQDPIGLTGLDQFGRRNGNRSYITSQYGHRHRDAFVEIPKRISTARLGQS